VLFSNYLRCVKWCWWVSDVKAGSCCYSK